MTRKEPTKQEPAPKRGRGRPPRAPQADPQPKQPSAKEPLDIGRASFSIAEFRRRNNLSDGTYSAMRKAGLGPVEMRPTGKSHGVVRISTRAEAEWQRQCERRTIPEEVKKAERERRAEISAAKKARAR
jgi:hypothetical protein